MRRLIYAASFIADADRIAQYIETNFGAARADAFIADLSLFCELVASQPRMGKKNHGYKTTLHGIDSPEAATHVFQALRIGPPHTRYASPQVLRIGAEGDVGWYGVDELPASQRRRG